MWVPFSLPPALVHMLNPGALYPDEIYGPRRGGRHRLPACLNLPSLLIARLSLALRTLIRSDGLDLFQVVLCTRIPG